ncbi:type II secretion system secretin GspD [Pseudomonas sp. FP597]|uniref:Type II secretion system secretin GspD n=1 Tax=Pseudomonas lactucae TaxID=2813360 RepID=A0A9X0Y9N1_9PSED|nr:MULTISPECIES: type II secretion system secretin GspD [Pseudomonas]MBN2975940.1 type II secretion system secretin GspD [Pseudomonas lactucae]MBN2985646.1 type II secretion system secretin GspD [Pseudomonas lactucae]WLI08976.1 type II secretion system secretin GspD [Pseudomonas sp. FP597]
MKWSGSNYVRTAAPFLLLALGACSSLPSAQSPPDSELGLPLATTQRSGDALVDRQRAQVQIERPPRPLHKVTSSGRNGSVGRTQTAPRKPLGDQPITLNFVEADIQAVVRALSRATGQQFLVDPRVKGTLTLVSEGQVPAHQAYDMLLATLRMQGFSVVDVGGIAQVVPEADAKLLGGPVDSADSVGSNGMLTRTFRLQYENAVNLIPVLRPIVSPNNPINAYPGNNTIVVTDYAENLTRVAQLIAGIDTPSAIDTDVVQVQNGIAVDIAEMVAQLLEQPGSDVTQKITVVGDPRSNAIVIRAGSPERTELARNLIYKLDNAQANPSNLHVVYLRNAQATKLAQSLRGLLTGESDKGGGDNARSVLSTMGATTTGSLAGQSSAQGTVNNGNDESALMASSSTGQPGEQQSEQNVAFSAGGVTLQADSTTNTLLISAPEPLYRNLREVIDMLDQRRAQVVIESLIVEVNEDDANEFGVQWQSGNLAGKGVIGGANLGGTGFNLNGKTSVDVLPGGLSLGFINGTVDVPGIGKVMDLKVLARALKSKGGSNVLSTPNLLTLDNEAASIFVGQTIPFVSGSYVTGGGGTSNNPFQTVTREEVGLKLNVRPQISEGGTVKLDIYQEVSSIDERASSSATSAGIVTNKRAIDTSILLDDGQIMVLGGLLQDGYSQSNEAVPWLSSIPGLGALFRNERRAIAKTNLMVFLRPYIIRDSGAGRAITLNRYDYMRRAQGRSQPEHNWALPDMQAPQLPEAAQAVPIGAAQPRTTHRAVPQAAAPAGREVY